MHLDGQFGDSDVVSNLFVQPTGGDLDHDLTLGNARQQEARAVPVRQTRFSGSCSGVTGFERFELMWLPDSSLILSRGWCTPGCSGQRACLVQLSLALRFWRNAPSLPKISSLPAICFPIYSSKSRHQLSGRFDRAATPVCTHTEQQCSNIGPYTKGRMPIRVRV